MNKASFFAPPERSDNLELTRQQVTINNAAFITALLDAVPDMMLVLNNNRQIVAVNKRLLSMFGVNNPSIIIGLRPGEAVGCIHSSEGPNGCGTSESCSACGAVITILASQESRKQVDGECRILITKDGVTALDMEVTATPLDLAEIQFTIFALKDIGSDKRRQVLERTFFHDVLNTVGGISGIANLLIDNEDLTPENEKEYKGFIVELSDNLVEEISQHRRLLAAERGEYIRDLKLTDIAELLTDVCKLYKNHARTPDRTINIEIDSNIHLKTDKSMLRRVVGNMLLNALEATPKGGTVTVSAVDRDENICISVINSGEMSKDIQLNLFNRSFSTKGKSGRGIGTYSMKLFGERYLGGEVGFNSSEGKTAFFIKLSKSLI
ncbi:MAG: PAS domain-containing sensor histidine kinase [Desulfuromonadaceae bacterium]|nr:PAS domain-containing sensor histidine kinase [Desulfuromonadaceae bacterium]MDD2855393.1 PAS domain-containing sensor histidine kinase [Desulfuromonadaceae bacterium]